MKRRFPRISQTALLAVAGLVTAVLAACSDGSNSQEASSEESTPETGASRLLVADPGAEVVYAYDLPSMEKLAEFPGMKLSTHLGAIALSDGRTLFVDEKSKQVVALDLSADPPAIIARASAPAPAVWGGVDPAERYFVYSSPPDEADVATATVWDLNDYKTYELKVPMGGDGELHVSIGGSPLHV